MILFLEDWARYPSAIVDTKTSNRSFMELADKLRVMGVANYYFFLALTQPDLQGVDPFSPNLDTPTKAKILVECRTNPWYFYREVMRIEATGGQKIPLIANRGNIGAYWCYFNHIDVGLVQPRQTGKSISADGISYYVINVAGRGATFQLITKDNDLRVKNIKRIKDLRSNLPDYINPYNKKVDADNQTTITAKALGNIMTSGVAQKDEAAAINLGRGATSESNQVDEGPFCALIHLTMDPFLSSGNAARANAKKAGTFYGNIFTTTAGKLDTKEGKYMYNMFIGGMTFDERKLYDCKNESAAHRMVGMESQGKKPMVYICLSHKQLGYSDEWLYSNMAESNAEGDSADRDYFNRWTSGSLSSPLTTAVLNAISLSKEEPTFIQFDELGYCINWYIPEWEIEKRLNERAIIMGNDTSSGIGKDAITLYLNDSETLETIGTMAISETNIYRLIEFCTKLMVKYPKLVFIPERQSQGITLIDTMLIKLIALNINPFKRIYNTIVEDGLLDTEEFDFIRRDPLSWPPHVADKYKNKFGYGTAAGGRHSRDNLYLHTLTRATQLNAELIKDQKLITEISSLVKKNGRIDHPEKGHDDMVIAYLLANWMLLHSRNLDYYGIHNAAGKAIELGRKEEVKVLTPLEQERNHEQERLKALVEAKIKLLGDMDDELEATLLEREIRILSRRLINDTFENKTVDDLIRSAKDTRAKVIDSVKEEYDYTHIAGYYPNGSAGGYARW